MKQHNGVMPERKSPMLIHTKALDGEGQIVFEGTTQIDPAALLLIAKSREDLVRAEGRQFTEGAVPFFAAQLYEAARAGRGVDELETIAFQVALAAWLADSIYGGVTETEFMHSNLHFTLQPSGAVKYSRIRAA